MPQAGDLPPVVDIETLGKGSTGNLGERLARFLAIVEAAAGTPPMIYTSRNFWQAHVADSRFARYPLWIAEYDVASPTLPNTWQAWQLWQFAENAPVKGIEKGADLSRLNPAPEGPLARVSATSPTTP